MSFKPFLFIALFIFLGCKNQTKEDKKARHPGSVKTHSEKMDTTARAEDSIPVMPVKHASFVMQLNGKTIYVDPVGDPGSYQDLLPDFDTGTP